MTDNRDLKYTIPKTYEQFVLEEKNLEQQGLYPDLGYEDISIHKGYGPMGTSGTRWCSKCEKDVKASSSAKHCPDCGANFGTVAKSSSVQKQADKNLEATKSEGGEYEYSKTTVTTSESTTTTETTKYSKK